MHEPEKRESLGDVCLDDLLKISSRSSEEESSNDDIPERIREIKRIIESFGGPKDSKRKPEYDKFVRMCCCRSAVIVSRYNELCESDESEEESDVLLISEVSDLDEDSNITGKKGEESKHKSELPTKIKAPSNNNSIKKTNKPKEIIQKKPEQDKEKVIKNSVKGIPKNKFQQEIINQRMKRIKKVQPIIVEKPSRNQIISNSYMVPSPNKLQMDPASMQNNVRSNPSESPRISNRSIILKPIYDGDINSIRSLQNNRNSMPQSRCLNKALPDQFKSFVWQNKGDNQDKISASKQNLPLKRPIPQLMIYNNRKTILKHGIQNSASSRSCLVNSKVKQKVVVRENNPASINKRVVSKVSQKTPQNIINTPNTNDNGHYTPHSCKYGNVIFSFGSPIHRLKEKLIKEYGVKAESKRYKYAS